MSPSEEAELDRKLRQLFQEAAWKLAGPDDEKRAEILARVCIDTMADQNTEVMAPGPNHPTGKQRTVAQYHPRVRITRARLTAAAILLVVTPLLAAGYLSLRRSPNTARQVDETAAVALVKAPPIELVSDFVLGHSGVEGVGPEIQSEYLSLPAVPFDARVALLEVRPEKSFASTATDSQCPRAYANKPLTLYSIPFKRDAREPVRVLVIWTEKPCGAALERGLRKRAIRRFEPGQEKELLREVAMAVEDGGKNPVLCYGFVVLNPQPN
jgi:hypothetical protein